ncbi:MAG: UDP-glucose 4-epimerase [Planctomycetes bacterium ADurb.Bin126]|nr:MAG: UDP-glucose 4-epimerase [Planctomycetes bacterium ADurb.Bin126]HOD82877.1 NAD(P)-dependent oxidoreductase [Phycisphaerae bacterium]HQL75297.1 NAD(P)-dependent oxidoreductase [Phycisphaerae bacterium]
MADERVIVTGAAGYLGHRVCDRLQQAGYGVVAVDLFPRGQQTLRQLLGPDALLVQADVRDLAAITALAREHRPVAWVQLAAKVGEKVCDEDPALAEQVNRESALQAAQTAREHGCKTFILSSTCSVYGIARDKAVAETDPANPISVYGRTKLAAEQLVLEQANGSMKSVVFRLSTLFGLSERMRFDLTVNQFAAEAHYENRLEVYSGASKRPYLNVDEAGRAFVWTIQNNLDSGVYNLGHSRLNYSKDEIVLLVRKHWPTVTVENLGAGKDRRDYVVNFDKMARRGFVVGQDVDEGLGIIRDFLVGRAQPIDFRSKLYEAT